MSWGYTFIGTKEEVSKQLAAVNPDACGATGAIEKGEAAFVKYHALALVDALDIETEAPYAKGNRVKVDAHGSHSWCDPWSFDRPASASPRATRSAFSLVVERTE